MEDRTLALKILQVTSKQEEMEEPSVKKKQKKKKQKKDPVSNLLGDLFEEQRQTPSILLRIVITWGELIIAQLLQNVSVYGPPSAQYNYHITSYLPITSHPM